MTKNSAESEIAPFFAAVSQIFTISDAMALRIHSDTRPLNTKIANLQKGIILVHNGEEVIGEGSGFGVPIGKYTDETYFSGSSVLQVQQQEKLFLIRKEFIMDLIARDKFRNVKLENVKLRKIFNRVSLLYQKHKLLAKLILLSKKVLFKFGVKPDFIKTSPKGKVIVTYTIDRNRILANLSLSQLDRNNLQKVFVLNEQGANFFRKYSDSDGLKLNDDEIGAWDFVTAQSARITDKDSRIGFMLKNVEGTVLRRGREMMKGSLDWIGLDYELSPNYDNFKYEIEVLG